MVSLGVVVMRVDAVLSVISIEDKMKSLFMISRLIVVPVLF